MPIALPHLGAVHNSNGSRSLKLMANSCNEEPLVLEAGRAERHYWRDLWRYRELLYFLARRDIAVRYKQTVFGVAWAIVRPLATMLIFTLIFGRIAKLPSHGAPYSLLVLSGMLPWFFFAAALGEASNSLVASANLISKIYFPRLLVPIATVAVALVDLAIGIGLLIVMMAFMGLAPNARLLAVPFFVLLATGTALGLGLWFAALNVKYRDFRFVVPFLLMIGLYISPIGFSSSVIPERWRLLYCLNPMVGVIEGFRWSVLGEAFPLRPDALLLSTGFCLLLLITGVSFFRRTERSFTDII